jgi:hypothetical protein
LVKAPPLCGQIICSFLRIQNSISCPLLWAEVMLLTRTLTRPEAGAS